PPHTYITSFPPRRSSDLFRYCLPLWTAGYPVTAWGDDTTAGQTQLPGWLCGATAPACVWTATNNYAPRGYFDGIDSAGCASGWADRKSTRLNSSHLGISY